jgi:hypothetical protein
MLVMVPLAWITWRRDAPRSAPVVQASNPAEPDTDALVHRVVEAVEARQRRRERMRPTREESPIVEKALPPSSAEIPATARPRKLDQVPPLDDLTQEVWKHETRDDAWARPIEQVFMEHVKASSGKVSVERMECGSSRCAATMKATSKKIVGDVTGWFGDGKTIFEYKPTVAGADEIDLKVVFLRDGHDIYGRALPRKTAP